MAPEVREYVDDDSPGWLRCRPLSFFATDYYDDVLVDRPRFDGPAICLVAVVGDDVVGLIDIAIDGAAATIESIAVLPDYQGGGTARRLLVAALTELPGAVRTLDAWTREMPAANAWYRANGFVEQYRYLHVYKESDEPDDGWTAPEGLSAPVKAFTHAPIEREDELRRRFRRVHVCRQYVREL